MFYHNITKDDMLNGTGLRVVLWVSGCENNCKGCQNPQTHDPNSGVMFDQNAELELWESLDHSWISGITFCGGDPLYPRNRYPVFKLIQEFKRRFPNKNIWLYSGYTWEEIQKMPDAKVVVDEVDVLCDGRFVEELADVNYPFAGSTNQSLIDVQASLKNNCKVLYKVV